MLTELRIDNFAIIENLELHLSAGLVTFTGETGAGKSIIIDAVETLLGGRAESVQVRSGEERASIEAIFQISDSSQQTTREILRRENLLDELNYLTLAREVRLNGRNVARINGRSVTTSLLREISGSLIDIHGQSEHLSLLNVSRHISLLDRFAALQPNSILRKSLESYSQTYRRLRKIQKELEETRAVERDSARKVDMLSFQINEIESAHLQNGEEEQLREERNRLTNAESLASFAQESLLSLDEGTAESPAASDLIGRVSDNLASLVKMDPSQAPMYDIVQSIFDNLTELTRSLQQYLETIEFNSSRLDQVEERLGLIQLLKRKYGDSITAVFAFYNQAKQQLNQITHVEERLQELESECVMLLEKLGLEGTELTKERQQAASLLSEQIDQELRDLQMPGARFQVDFQQKTDSEGAFLPSNSRVAYYPNGLEKVEFLIAPNPGEGFKPLVKIASGGETSRLMLALKHVLAQADDIPTLIFDEIDQGVGGRVGSTVGQKLWQLGRRHQVLCITHLPQLAAYADQHFHIEKQVRSGRTVTLVKALDDDARLKELAQMLGGISEGTLQSARELILYARNQASHT